MPEERATWVYAVTSAGGSDLAASLTDVAGIGGQCVRIVNKAGLAAVVSSVDGSYANEDELQRRLQDLSELEAMALLHHGVVEKAAAEHQVLPLRLATVYRDDHRVRGLLTDRRTEFAAALRWLNSRTECGVKVWARADMQAAGQGAVVHMRDTRHHGSDDGSGTGYLLQRSASRKARDDYWQRAAAGSEQIHQALAALAVAAHRHAPQDARLASPDGCMVLNGAYLIDTERFAEFTAAARAMATDPMFRLDVTGPWPPYTFAGGVCP